MVYAMIVLFSKNESVTFAQFKSILETKWVPLLEEVSGPLFPLTYVRRYVADEGNEQQRRREGPLGLPALMIGREEQVPWDCLVEATFEDDLHLQQFFALMNEKEPAEKLLECEKTFSDIHKLRVIAMENHVSVSKTRRLKTWEKEQ